MPIARHSSIERALMAAAGLLPAIAAPLCAEARPSPTDQSSEPGYKTQDLAPARSGPEHARNDKTATGEGPVAREAPIAREGQAAMDRVERAMVKRRNEAGAREPANLPEPSQVDRARVSRAMRGHIDTDIQADRARAAIHAGEAGLARERDAMLARLHQALGLSPPDGETLALVGKRTLERRFVPILFVSISMPLTTLRNYAAQLERAGGVMALRGMPGGLRQVRPMAQLAAQILRRDPGCEGPGCVMRDVQLIVDPILFRQHGVSAVPALALLPGDPTQPYCEREDDSPRAAHLVLGDAALDGMLEAYARAGGREEVRDVQHRLEIR